MRERIRVQDIGLDRDEIERRKQLTRDLWAGRPLDHIPVYITVENPQPKYTIREQFQDADKQLEEALTVVDLTWKHVPEGDLVPAMRPDVGCSPLATAFGAELFWGDDPNQTCGVKNPPLTDVEQAYELTVPPPDAGQLAEGTTRVRRFADVGEGLISVSLLDMAGGLNVAADLLGCNRLYEDLYENPEALECLLGKNYEYSKNDLPAVKRVCRRKAFIYLGGLPAEPDEAIRVFREIMELMAPDVIVIPHVIVRPDKRPAELYRRMREIAVEYARRMDWGWE